MESHDIVQRKKRYWILPVLGLFIFASGFFSGSFYGIRSTLFEENSEVVDLEKVINLYGKTRSSEVDFNQFWDVWDKIHDKHVHQPIDDVALFYSAIQGMVDGLDDPYSIYFPPAEASEFVKDLSGEFEGIGAEIGLRDGQLQIVAPLPQSPAEKAGIRAGDAIYAIDGKDTFNMSLEEAVTLIRGEKGSQVVLTISHDGFDHLEEIAIERDTINVPTVIWEQKEDDIAYLRISHFTQDTWTEFDQAVRELIDADVSGLVLDLRSNPGGFLETSIDVASEWVESGIIVSEGNDPETAQSFRTRGRHRLADMNTVVLVDEGTASGAEIVAGALQDLDIAKVIGMQTYGKGSVQDFEVLPDGSALKLTIAKWFTPAGRAIDGEGIAPDIILEEMFRIENEGTEQEQFIDLGLERAIEELK